MDKIIKKIRKLKDQLDSIEEKEDNILDQLDIAIEELEESNSKD
tara:strand:- start:241 stop:372 length:132 start_codon:yes stop_codon:yes gene_type:complete